MTNALLVALIAASVATPILVARMTTKRAVIVTDKLDVIHTLVNSNMTAAMQAELDATIRELAMMREVVQLHRVAGQSASKESLSAIELTEGKIVELKAALAERLVASRKVDDQQAEQRRRA